MNQKVFALPKQSAANKNTLQELLLGIGLLLRDLELVCFADHEETPVPNYLINSCITATDADSVTRAMELVADFLNYDLQYVSLFNFEQGLTNSKSERSGSQSKKKSNQQGQAKKVPTSPKKM
jgi:hypothetical protein